MITHGLTQVLVTVFGPREAKMRSQTLHDRAVLNVEMSVAPFSTGERRKRSRADRRILELASMIASTFEPVVQTTLYPRSQIDIYVHVLQQDGSLLPACINATTLALVTAGVPLHDFENDVPHMTVAVMPRTRKVTLVTMETRLHVERFKELFELACEAGQTIHKELRAAVKERTVALVGAMEAGSKHGMMDDRDRDVVMEDRI
ncbi:3' exoribonuclease family, domain 1-domain-containing protein [Daedaleopsis nitida]|nr:3' exoribonuclease family, domain 1-domain-containing protein [Daedaleopsis nitida]